MAVLFTGAGELVVDCSVSPVVEAATLVSCCRDVADVSVADRVDIELEIVF